MASVVESLERVFAAWLAAPAAVAATGFGRGALVLALAAVGIGGGEVAVPDFVCAQVPEAVRRAGGRPVFYRVERDLTVRREKFRAALRAGCRAAVAVHYFGQVLPGIEGLAGISRERGVPLVEDCALALGSSAEGRPVGTFGELAVFSFTKSDWCYGGGVVAARSAERAGRLQQSLQEKFVQARGLSFSYGVLRRIDHVANRPCWSHSAAWLGRNLEGWLGLGGGNFYDAGRFDTQMPGFAARRAIRRLGKLGRQTGRRCRIVQQLLDSLRGMEQILMRPVLDSGDSGAFFLLQSPAGRAAEWAEQADRDGVTLRRCWPAYQSSETGQYGETLDWLARHLLIFEVHPGLTPQEVERVARTLRKLGAAE